MKRCTRCVLSAAKALLCVLIFWCVPCSAQDVSVKLAGYMEQKAEQDEFSGTVMVTKDGNTLLSSGYGWANREHQVPNSPQTKFRIGSVTKQFTAMAILILQEQGKLSVEDRIARHIPDPPALWSDITIHQLLTHTSGIMHSWPLPDWNTTMMQPATLAETINRFKKQPLLFNPGEDYTYSGVGYFILAQVVECVSGQSYEIFLQQHIFDPLGMRDTGVDVYTRILPHRASGYIRTDGQIENAPYIYMPILTGGGNLYSTAIDLTKWDRALAAGKLISEASYRCMYTPVRNNYGYGWTIRPRAGHTEITHSGGVPGFRTTILRVPEESACVVLFTNIMDESQGKTLPIARDLMDIVLGDLNQQNAKE
jgi:CubicO group peptidase (beta-lactamase class C family)